MKIQKITSYTNFNNYQNNQKPSHNTSPIRHKALMMPTTAQYLAFTGGYSLNLEQTVKQLDILAEKNSKLYPLNIREWLGMFLEEGNKAKKTLIGAHKEYFERLEGCFSLAAIKKDFDEFFEEVIPASSITPKEGSFIDRFQKGELEYFDSDEDLSVQLIKLYWGQGFSLNDLKRYAGGQDLYHVMKKLHIPTASRDYGHVLKFSDPQYNERLTAEMTEKRLAALDRKVQLEEGEPVYIPNPRKGKPLSAEHKQRISEGLKRHYQENPETILAMSERQKEFYRQHPEEVEEFKRVLKKAWGIFGAEHIKKAMSKFFSGKKVALPNLEEPVSMTREQSKTMKAFWKQNEWAKKSFSKNMKYSWKKIKEENETFFTIKSSPSQIIRFVEEKTGMKPGSLNIDTVYNPYLKTSSIDETAQEIVKQHTNINGLANVMADTYQIAVFNIVGALKDMKMTNSTKPHKKLLDYATAIVWSNKTADGSYKTQYTLEAQQDFLALAMHAAESRCPELVNIVNKALDDAFEFALSAHPEVILK